VSCERQTSSYRLKEMEKGRLMVRVNGRYHDVDDDDWSFDPRPCLSAYLKHAPRSHSGASPSPLSRATPRTSIDTTDIRLQTTSSCPTRHLWSFPRSSDTQPLSSWRMGWATVGLAGRLRSTQHHGGLDTEGHRIFLAENWRRRSKFEEVSFIFPNAPSIPITLVRQPPTAANTRHGR
jgi:hypothetical protein